MRACAGTSLECLLSPRRALLFFVSRVFDANLCFSAHDAPHGVALGESGISGMRVSSARTAGSGGTGPSALKP